MCVAPSFTCEYFAVQMRFTELLSCLHFRFPSYPPPNYSLQYSSMISSLAITALSKCPQAATGNAIVLEKAIRQCAVEDRAIFRRAMQDAAI